MNGFPAWLPIPRSWFNAIALILLMVGVQRLTGFLWIIIDPIIRLPRIGLLIYVLLFVLLPIGVIALSHHWLHRFLDQVFPESRMHGETSSQAALPGLLSWWEGLYGWIVSYLSIFVWSILIAIVLPIPPAFNSPLVFPLSSGTPSISLWEIAEVIVRTIAAACLYQFEYAVKRRLVAANSSE